MIVISPSGIKFDYLAIKLGPKQKIHFKHKKGSTCCSISSKKIDLESDTVEIDNIDNINDFVGILNQNALCKKCKESLEQAVYGEYEFYFKAENETIIDKLNNHKEK